MNSESPLTSIDPGQCQSPLILVFATFIGVTYGTNSISLEKNHLRDTFVGIDLGWQRRSIANFHGDLSTPFRLQRRDIDDDPTTGIGALTHADHQNLSRNIERLDCLGQGKAVRRNHDVVLGRFRCVDCDEHVIPKVLGIHDSLTAMGCHVGEYFENVAHTHVIAIAGNAIRNLPLALDVLGERVDGQQFSNLSVTKY